MNDVPELPAAPLQLPADLVTQPAEPDAIDTELSPLDEDPLSDLLDDDEVATPAAPIVPAAPREEGDSFDFLEDETAEDVGLDLPADDDTVKPDPAAPADDDASLDFLDEPADATTDLAPPTEVEDDGTLDFLDEPTDAPLEPAMPTEEGDDAGLDFLDEPTDTTTEADDITDALFPDDAPAPADDPLMTDDDIFGAAPDGATDTLPSQSPPQLEESDDFGNLFDEVEDAPADAEGPASDADEDFDALFDVDETSAREGRGDDSVRLSGARALHYLNSIVTQLGNFGAYIAVVATDESARDRAVESDRPLVNSPIRHWTDNTGSFHTDGRLVRIAADHVRLLKENGRFTTVPMRRLSKQDRQYVASFALELEIR